MEKTGIISEICIVKIDQEPEIYFQKMKEHLQLDPMERKYEKENENSKEKWKRKVIWKNSKKSII